QNAPDAAAAPTTNVSAAIDARMTSPSCEAERDDESYSLSASRLHALSVILLTFSRARAAEPGHCVRDSRAGIDALARDGKSATPMGRRIVEASDARREALKRGLESVGYVVDAVASGDEGLEHALSGRHDLAILDVMLPGLDGFEILRRVRAEGRTLPV